MTPYRTLGRIHANGSRGSRVVCNLAVDDDFLFQAIIFGFLGLLCLRLKKVIDELV
jgi:hypothetical protein